VTRRAFRVVAVRQHESIDSVFDQIARADFRTDDDGQSGRHGFEHNHAEGVGVGKHHERIRRPVVALDVCRDRTGEGHSFTDSQSLRLGPVFLLVAFADNNQTDPGPGGAGARGSHRRHHGIESLQLEVHADKQDEEVAVVQSVAFPDFRAAIVSIRGGETPEVDPGGHDLPFAGKAPVFPLERVARDRGNRQEESVLAGGQHAILHGDHAPVEEAGFFLPDVANPIYVRRADQGNNVGVENAVVRMDEIESPRSDGALDHPRKKQGTKAARKRKAGNFAEDHAGIRRRFPPVGEYREFVVCGSGQSLGQFIDKALRSAQEAVFRDYHGHLFWIAGDGIKTIHRRPITSLSSSCACGKPALPAMLWAFRLGYNNAHPNENRELDRPKTMKPRPMPDASLIVVTRNTREMTLAAVRSALDHQGGLAVEVTVVDNGSTDGTTEALREIHPEVRCLRSETNLGFAKAVNQAARECWGEFLLLLNSDAVLQPGALTAAIEWMRAHPRCGVAGAQLLNDDGSRQNSIANFPTLATELLNKSLLRRIAPRRHPGKEQAFSSPVEVETVVGAFMLVRRELWDLLGGLDERFFFFIEETDFCFQARRVGWSTMHLPQVLVTHGGGQSAKQVLPAARVEYWRSRYAYFGKNQGPLTRLVLRIGLGVRLLVDWVAALFATGLTLGRNERWRNRFEVCSVLMWWHLRGCPAKTGLPR
jgi:GT2 family glycosyltransferase